jgi:hypothetical protein
VRGESPSPRRPLTYSLANAWKLGSSFTERMMITATWRDGDRALFERESEPLRSDALEPIFGPDWTSYAPLARGEPLNDS